METFNITISAIERDAILAGLDLLQISINLGGGEPCQGVASIWANGRDAGLDDAGIDALTMRIKDEQTN